MVMRELISDMKTAVKGSGVGILKLVKNLQIEKIMHCGECGSIKK
jgi:hypothetical protein